MKKTLTAILILIMVLSLFMTSAFAVKPENKPNKKESTEEPMNKEDDEDEEGQKKPNEKRDAKALFKESVRPLIDEIHANREEWGALSDQQHAISESIETKISAIKENGFALDEASLALFKEKIADMKALKAQMKGLKEEIHALWKQYIAAKKISDIDAAKIALNSLIAKQELRIDIRKQIIGVLGEINGILDGAGLINEEPKPEPEPEQV